MAVTTYLVIIFLRNLASCTELKKLLVKTTSEHMIEYLNIKSEKYHIYTLTLNDPFQSLRQERPDEISITLIELWDHYEEKCHYTYYCMDRNYS